MWKERTGLQRVRKVDIGCCGAVFRCEGICIARAKLGEANENFGKESEKEDGEGEVLQFRVTSVGDHWLGRTLPSPLLSRANVRIASRRPIARRRMLFVASVLSAVMLTVSSTGAARPSPRHVACPDRCVGGADAVSQPELTGSQEGASVGVRGGDISRMRPWSERAGGRAGRWQRGCTADRTKAEQARILGISEALCSPDGDGCLLCCSLRRRWNAAGGPPRSEAPPGRAFASAPCRLCS